MTLDRSARSARQRRCGWRLLLAAAACWGAAALSAGPATAAPPAAKAASGPVAAAAFARVGDAVISHQDFETAFAQAARGKFYHGKAPDNAIAALQREVGNGMVDELLLVKEAKRRKLQPDHAAISKTLAGYEERYRTSAQWKADRARLLPAVKAKLERDSLIEQLGLQVRTPGAPAPGDLERYWDSHKDKFTAPEQVHLAMILLKVAPSSPQAQWDGARAEGAALVRRLRSGADFAQLAQLHSGDASAERGGDMGYVHRGMLPEPAQQAVDRLKPGEISEPVVLLEGVAVLRLEQRKSPRLNPLGAVRDRARDLWARDKGDQAWSALLARLRGETPIQLDESRFLPLTAAAAPGGSIAPR